MRTIRTGAVAILAIGLLVSSTVGVAGENAATTIQGPDEVTAEWAFGPEIRASETTVDGHVVHSTGGAWRPQALLAASDTRLQGMLSIAANSLTYDVPDGPTMWHYAFRIENDEGAWQMDPVISLTRPDGTEADDVGVFVGERAYEGLTAVLTIHTKSSTWELDGYILEEALPPAPMPVRIPLRRFGCPRC